MSNEISWVIELLKILPTLIVGLVAAFIAWQQAQISKEQKRIAQAKLKLDLFVKRLAVYKEVYRLVEFGKNLKDIKEGIAASKQLIELAHEATFLFGDDITELIEKSGLAIIDLVNGIKATADNENVVPAPVMPSVRTASEHFKKVDIEPVFRPYLDLSQWK